MFSDVNKKEWFYSVIMWGYKNGIIGGYPDGTFKPNQGMTRAEAVQMIHNAFQFFTGYMLRHNEKMAQKIMPHSVYIRGHVKDKVYEVGSGTWIAPWTVLTCDHVSERKDNTPYDHLTIQGWPGAGFAPMGFAPMKVTGIQHFRDNADWAVMNVEKPAYQIDCPVIDISTDQVKQGENVYVAGNPFGFPFDYCTGSVREPGATIKYWENPCDVVPISAPINPGNSGGLATNAKGELIGIPSAGVPSGNDMTFMLPMTTVVPSLKKAGVL